MTNHMPHLTLIDDDQSFLTALAASFEQSFKISTYTAPLEALENISLSFTDGVLLDVHMQDHSGLKICREIKQLRTELPVFFYSGDISLDTIQGGFDMGGSDFFSKDMRIPELITRLKQRLRPPQAPQNRVLCWGDFSIDLRTNSPSAQGRSIKLTAKEFDLFKLFLEHPGRVFPKSELLTRLWVGVSISANNIDTHVFNLRKKLGHSGSSLVSLKGRGYVLRTVET